ncbi:sodium/glucose cotransporter [Arenibacter sp. NBRC 103722]|uniref:sodium:solute symporter family transporter n=1 Tax=Arenibacter sp. NBRC 103722 TaxID=1113929 RepID=UPI000858C699|nr:sodium/solute symporter [Arenibacter sp. NBRC 103722]GBF18050.1 sodium/glucose cotransporter [Arenibacter sp. NBRC 103722]
MTKKVLLNNNKNIQFWGYLLSIICFFIYFKANSQDRYFEYSHFPNLPPNTGQKVQPGLAGAYTGIDDDFLIVAGGANFPDKLPWEGGTKTYYDEIFILKKKTDGTFQWETNSKRIPFSSGYGGAISTNRGLLCFGGNNSDSTISDSWFIDYIPETGEIEISQGPILPVPLTNFAFAKVDNDIYVAGGISEFGGASTNSFYRLSIGDNNFKDWKWELLPSWDGDPRAFSVGVGQSNGLENCFYLFSGRNIDPQGEWKVLADAHVYNPTIKKWQIISKGIDKEFKVMAGTAFPVGASSIIFPSGSDGNLAIEEIDIKKRIEHLESRLVNGEDVGEVLQLAKLKLTNHLNNHPGFGNKVYGFNTISQEFYEIEEIPQTGQVTTSAVAWGGDIVVPSGEVRPGVRTPEVLKITINKDAKHLGIIDMLVIGLYFLTLAWMGYFFSKRQKSTEDYFKGGGRIPWWAAGLSIFGTALSAITFMAVPAKTFATDWSYFMLNMTIFLVAPVIVFWFIPFFRKLNVTTAYEFLESRFNLTIRLLGSLSFILFQIGRMGVVMFLPSIALNVVTGIDIFVCISLMGVVSMIYTIYGGIEAVIWTDVVQVIVLLGGAILSLVLMVTSIDGGLKEILEMAKENDKFNIIDLDLSLKQPTVWVMLLGGIFANITTYGSDQTMVQRYLTTKTQKEAQKSVWTNAILTIPATLIFFFVGTTLFAFFKNYPSELNPTFENNDAIFPWYIVSELPTGISGLLIAAIFAAAMSSLSSSMNSAATSYATDIHFRFGWNKKTNELKIARKATLMIGIIGTIFAIMMATMDVKSLWDEFQKVLGLVIGSLGGVFLLGIFTKRANSIGVLIGIVVSIMVQVYVGVTEPVHILVYSATGVISCFFVGYVASLFFAKD